MDNIYVISIIAFIAVIAAIEGLYLFWRSIDIPAVIKVNQRLRELSANGMKQQEAISILRERQYSQIPAWNNLLMAIPRLHSIDRMLEQAGMGLSVSRFVGLQVVVGLVLFSVFYGLLNWILIVAAVLAVTLGVIIPYTVVNRRRNSRRDLFSKQLPETLDFISRSLRAGNPLMATIKSVSENMAEPSAGEFAITFHELNYGADLNEALDHLGERTGSDDVRFFITAVLIQRSTGGNLAEILNRISAVMRNRSRTYREVDILASEMKLSANILIALPFIVAVLITLVEPHYLDVLFTTDLGLMLIALQMVLMGMGYWVVQKMIHFRV